MLVQFPSAFRDRVRSFGSSLQAVLKPLTQVTPTTSPKATDSRAAAASGDSRNDGTIVLEDFSPSSFSPSKFINKAGGKFIWKPKDPLDFPSELTATASATTTNEESNNHEGMKAIKEVNEGRRGSGGSRDSRKIKISNSNVDKNTSCMPPAIGLLLHQGNKNFWKMNTKIYFRIYLVDSQDSVVVRSYDPVRCTEFTPIVLSLKKINQAVNYLASPVKPTIDLFPRDRDQKIPTTAWDSSSTPPAIYIGGGRNQKRVSLADSLRSKMTRAPQSRSKVSPLDVGANTNGCVIGTPLAATHQQRKARAQSEELTSQFAAQSKQLKQYSKIVSFVLERFEVVKCPNSNELTVTIVQLDSEVPVVFEKGKEPKSTVDVGLSDGWGDNLL